MLETEAVAIAPGCIWVCPKFKLVSAVPVTVNPRIAPAVVKVVIGDPFEVNDSITFVLPIVIVVNDTFAVSTLKALSWAAGEASALPV